MRALSRPLFTAAAAAMLLAVGSAAHALRFQQFTSGGMQILVVRDCQNFSTTIPLFRKYDDQHPCRGGKKDEGFRFRHTKDPFVGDDVVLEYILNLSESSHDALSPMEALASGYGGDAATVETILSLAASPKPFDEVWLLSGGGDVEAGIGIAHVLRHHRMAVRVPKGFSCVSACTIAFMGGMLRFIDDGGTFQVHSASRFDGGVERDDLDMLLSHPDAGLANIARDQLIGQRYLAIRLMTLFQNTLVLMTRTPQVPEDQEAFCRWAGGTLDNGDCSPTDTSSLPDPLPYLDPGNPQRTADTNRILREGPAAIQDILMRIERECMQIAIADLEATVTQRGPRAGPALNMVREMFITSIKDTNYLTPLQLKTMGYVTPELHLAQ